MSYLVTSPLVLVKVPDEVGDGYRVDYHYQGSVIPALTDEQEKHFLAEGLVEKGGRKSKAKADGDGDGDPAAEPPPKVAVKSVWVDYVVAKTANTDKPVTAEEADAMSKDDLIAEFGD